LGKFQDCKVDGPEVPGETTAPSFVSDVHN